MIETDLARFSFSGASSRLAAYRAGANGKTAAEIGLANALARRSAGSNPLASRVAPKANQRPQSAPKVQGSETVNRAAIIQSANASETKRWATVLGHEVSRGRERLAAHLLSQPQRFSAAQIIAAMSSEANGGAKSHQAAPNWGTAASWDEVRADVLVRTGRA